MKLKQVTRWTLFTLALAFCLLSVGLLSVGLLSVGRLGVGRLGVGPLGVGRMTARSGVGQDTPAAPLQGAAAIQQLKQQGQYASLQEAMKHARYTVSHEVSTPLRRPAWHAPNPAAGYDAYVTADGVSIALQDQSYVSLNLRGIGYGADLHDVAAGAVSGAQQTITIERGAVREWYVNGAAGLEQGFTLNAPPTGEKQAGARLRLALQLSAGWRAVAAADGQRVSVLNASGALLEYGKLAAWDAQGQVLPAALTVEHERIVIKVDDTRAVYPLTIDPIFSQQQKLSAPDAAANDSFGDSVALDGNTAAVDAPLDDVSGANQGSVYVFVRSGTVWTFQANLTAVDGAAGDQFGFAFALSGDTLVIGAVFDDETVPDQGSVYVFTRSGTSWSQQQKLTANDGATGDHFGIAVALSGNTFVAGAADDDVNANTDQGSAYVFTRSGTVWAQQQKLTAGDGAANDRFGRGVALDGETAIVGAPFDDSPIGIMPVDQGSVYVFTRNGTVWTQQQRLTAGDGTAGDVFGYSVALSGETVLGGAPEDDSGMNADQGSTYVFTRSGTVWTQQTQITASDGAAGDQFGYAVALDGDTALVGARADDVGTNGNQGSAYVFTRSGTVWSQQQKLTASDGAVGDQFGYAVALDGATALVGAGSDDVGTNNSQGSAYFFTRSGAGWSQQQKLIANDGTANDFFGTAVALDGGTALVGAWLDNIGANTDQGSAYVFVCSACPAIALTPTSLPNGVIGTSYNQMVTASGGTGPYQFSVSSGALPPGLTLAQSGLLTGTPMTAGTFSFTITATILSSLYPGSRAYTLTVTPPCPAITVNPTNPSLPNGRAGVAYAQTFTQTGGAGTATFSISAGALPTGLTLAAGGLLSGTPTVSGT